MDKTDLFLLREQHAKVKNQQLLYESEIRRVFRPGTAHYYQHGQRMRLVTVVSVSGDRVRVQGKTGTTHWIHAYRFIEIGIRIT